MKYNEKRNVPTAPDATYERLKSIDAQLADLKRRYKETLERTGTDK